jgi:WD40 repeat protein/predicted Ser/Thr protein kinase
MNDALNCQRCGAALPTRTPEGFCPRCLMESAVRLVVAGGEPGQESAAAQPAPGAAQSPPALSGRFGNYELIERIASGGMGVVYKARQLGLERIVAIKVLPFGAFTRDEFVRRFQLEAGAAARLRHPNIVTIYEVGRADGYPFFSMEYVEGTTLAELVRNGPLEPVRAVRLVRAIAEAIHYAHQQGILHRDLKPSNVLIDSLDQPRVSDFGLARDLADDSELTVTGQAIGSPNFMPPEQAEGRPADISPRSDVYALGAMLYFLLTGRPPFAADSAVATLRQVVQNDPVAPRLLNPGVPRDLETICLRCLEKEPARRYVTAQEVADELGRYQRSEPIVARPITFAERAWRWCRRRPAVAGLLATLLVVVAAGFAATLWQWHRAEHNAGRFAESVTRLELERAEDRLAQGETADALASLAQLLRREPQNRVAGWRILSALSQRNYLKPAPLAIQDEFVGRNSPCAQHGHWLVTATNNATVLQLWKTSGDWKLARLMPCQESVRVTAFRHDGAQLVAANAGGSVLIFDVASGTLAAGPHSTGAYIDRILISPDGRQVLAHASGPGSEDWRRAKLLVLDAASGRLLREEPKTHWAAFSPDGRLLVTVEGNVAQLRDGATWEPVGKPLRHGARVNTAEFSPDSLLLITASADRTARLWRTADGDQVGAPLRHDEQVLSAVFSPTGKRVLTQDLGADGQLWDNAAGQAVGQPFKLMRGFGSDSFTRDGTMLAAYYQNKLWLRDGANGELRAEVLDIGHRVTRSRFIGDSRRLVASSFSGIAQVWEAPPLRARELRLAHRAEVNGVAFSADGSILVTAAREGSSRVWNARTGEPVSERLAHQIQVRHAAFSPDGRRVATASSDGTARVWELPAGQPMEPDLRHGAPLRCVNFSPDGRWLVTASDDNTARLWDAETRRPVGEPLQHKDDVVWAAFSPGSDLVATVSHDHSARLWRVPAGTPAGPPMLHSNSASFASFSPDGRHLATCGGDRAARIWDVKTGLPITPPLRHEANVDTVHFDTSGRRVVTASEDGTAQIWDAATGARLTRRLQHGEAVKWAEFSPGGDFVITGSGDHTARIWDAATGFPLADPLQHDGIVSAARWSPDGASVVTAAYDRSARIWPVGFLIDAPAPEWLPTLAEAIGGKRLGNDGIAETVEPAEYFRLKQDLLSRAMPTAWRAWLEWFFADEMTR